MPKHFIIVILISFAFNSCKNSEVLTKDCVCTLEFRSYSVFVTDKNKKPIDSLSTVVKNQKTGKIYKLYEFPFLEAGRYSIMDDGYTKEFSVQPEAIIFTAKKDSFNIEQIFYFNTDECNCHINKAAGPDTIKVI